MKSSWLVGCGDFLDLAFHTWTQDRPDARLERIVVAQGEDFEFDMTAFDGLACGEGEVFVALDERFGNFKRLELMREARRRGLRLASFVHSSALLAQDVVLGEGVYIGPGVIVGHGSRIEDGVAVHAGVHIGPRAGIASLCWLEHGVQLGAGVKLGSHCTLRAGVVVGNGVAVGTQCELGWVQAYRKSVPDKTVFDPRYDEPIHIYEY